MPLGTEKNSLLGASGGGGGGRSIYMLLGYKGGVQSGYSDQWTPATNTFATGSTSSRTINGDDGWAIASEEKCFTAGAHYTAGQQYANCYIPGTDAWETLTNYASYNPGNFGIYAQTNSYIGDYGYMIGGQWHDGWDYHVEQRVQQYTYASAAGTWANVAGFSSAYSTSNGPACNAGGKIYVGPGRSQSAVGGSPNWRNCGNAYYEYTGGATNSWSAKTSMPDCDSGTYHQQGMASFVLSDDPYWFGGNQPTGCSGGVGNTAQLCMWQYSVSGDSFTSKTQIPSTQRGEGATLAQDEEAYMMNAYDGSLWTDFYSYTDDTWVTLTSGSWGGNRNSYGVGAGDW